MQHNDPTTNLPSLDQLIPEIHAWQLETFSQATVSSKIEHLTRELSELKHNPSDPGEIADCFFLLSGIASIQGIDLATAVRDKFAINKARTWGNPDEHGVVEHIKPNSLDQAS